MKVIIKQHPGTGLWVTSDGRVIMPPCPRYPKFRFTYGCKSKSTGYMVVKFRGKQYFVHRLICETFHGLAPVDRPTCDHKNRVKTANFVENLCWADMHMQNSNKQIVDEALARYGIRSCEDESGYNRAYYAENIERERARHREYHAKNAKRLLAYQREWRARQRALGRRYRRCLDGKQHWISDEEYDARCGINRQLPLF